LDLNKIGTLVIIILQEITIEGELVREGGEDYYGQAMKIYFQILLLDHKRFFMFVFLTMTISNVDHLTPVDGIQNDVKNFRNWNNT
jgi:hypothetical protein